MRDRIWYSFADVKTNEYYTAEVTRLYQKWDWVVNTFLVITTSGSITAWAMWKVYPFLWGVIIGVSQLISFVKPFLLFPKYISAYNDKNVLLQHLALEFENLWYDYENGTINEDQAQDNYNDLRQRAIEIDKFSNDLIVLRHKKCTNRADLQAINYLNRMSNG